MKTALVRILTIATLATSLSAFAATDEPKTDDAAATSASNSRMDAPRRTRRRSRRKPSPGATMSAPNRKKNSIAC